TGLPESRGKKNKRSEFTMCEKARETSRSNNDEPAAHAAGFVFLGGRVIERRDGYERAGVCHNSETNSAMRFEMPTSLSYQATTFMSLPIVFVRLPSTMQEWGLPRMSDDTYCSSV